MATRAVVLEAAQGCPKKYPFFLLVFDSETGVRKMELENSFKTQAEAEAASVVITGEKPVKTLKEEF